MAKFNRGDQVSVQITALTTVVVASDGGSVTVESVTGKQGTQVVPEAAVTLVKKALPETEGTVLKVTNWYGTAGVESWSLMRFSDGWRFSCGNAKDGAIYTTKELEDQRDRGYFDFDVLFAPEPQENGF